MPAIGPCSAVLGVLVLRGLPSMRTLPTEEGDPNNVENSLRLPVNGRFRYPASLSVSLSSSAPETCPRQLPPHCHLETAGSSRLGGTCPTSW